MTEELTPAQKAARTRAANKAKALIADPTPPTAVKAIVQEKVEPIVEDVVNTINEAGDSQFVQVTLSRVTPKFPAVVRDTIYTVGIWLGVLGTIATPIAAALTGDAQYIAATVGTISLALTNLLAKLNLSKTPTDLIKGS